MCAVIDKKSGHNIANVHMTQNRLFPINVSNDVLGNAMIANLKNESELWYLRYEHLNARSLKLLSKKQMVVGLPKIGELKFCEGCVYKKQSKASFPGGKSWRASKCLELVHTDLCGPMKIESLGGSRYFLLVTDDFSRMSWVYFLKFKSEAFENFKKFKAFVEKQSGRDIIALRTDRGGEFMYEEFNAFCDEHGIRRELTTPYTPEQNGVAERKNRTVVEMARSMLKGKALSDNFWGEAIATSVYLLNISPTRDVWNKTPFEAWKGRKPGVSHLKVFGYVAYALVNNRYKLDEKSETCIFIGYCSKAYRLYNPVSGKVIISRNVVFNEEARLKWNVEKNGSAYNIPVEGEADEQLDTESPVNSISSSPVNSPPSTPGSNTSSGDDRDIPTRKTRSLAEIYSSCNYALLVTDPILFEEANAQPEWKNAMEEEMLAIERNDTWELIDAPEDKNVIGLKWVFRTKYNADGSIQKHKARLVAKGY
ncbi:hypothetical protein AgCh_020161 [Apium graveolens]